MDRLNLSQGNFSKIQNDFWVDHSTSPKTSMWTNIVIMGTIPLRLLVFDQKSPVRPVSEFRGSSQRVTYTWGAAAAGQHMFFLILDHTTYRPQPYCHCDKTNETLRHYDLTLLRYNVITTQHHQPYRHQPYRHLTKHDCDKTSSQRNVTKKNNYCHHLGF